MPEGYNGQLDRSDACRCLYRARCRLMESSRNYVHLPQSYHLLWEAQDAVINNREIDLKRVFRDELPKAC